MLTASTAARCRAGFAGSEVPPRAPLFRASGPGQFYFDLPPKWVNIQSALTASGRAIGKRIHRIRAANAIEVHLGSKRSSYPSWAN